MTSWVELDSPLLMWIFLLLRLDQGQNLVKRGRSEYFWLLQLGQKEVKSFYWICKAGGALAEFWGSNNNFFHLAHLNFPSSTYHFLKTNSPTFNLALSIPRDVFVVSEVLPKESCVSLRKRALDVAKKDFVWREVLLWHFQTQYCQKLSRNFPTWKLEKLVSPGRRHKNMFTYKLKWHWKSFQRIR